MDRMRTAAMFLTLCLILSLSACGGSQKAEQADTSAQQDGKASSADQDDIRNSSDISDAAETVKEEGAQIPAAADTAQTAAEQSAAVSTAADETAEPDLQPDYAKEENWAYFALGEEKEADLFLICPTVDTQAEYNMSMEDEKLKQSFLGALNMERGIYEEHTRMFAPYYRQASMKNYDLTPEERELYLELAYRDVSAAFSWYLEHENQGRPIVLAGFSQGADMCYRVLKEFFSDSALQEQLVAAYAIGWAMTDEMTAEYPQIKPAASDKDTGVVISFECESEDLTESVINPPGQKAVSINPLNWRTDSTPADKSLNTGACFTDYSGGIRQEIPALCGCYIDAQRGVLKVTDVTPQEYPPILPVLPEGSYHLYDFQFFYRNLQQNVELRINSFMENLLENAA